MTSHEKQQFVLLFGWYSLQLDNKQINRIENISMSNCVAAKVKKLSSLLLRTNSRETFLLICRWVLFNPFQFKLLRSVLIIEYSNVLCFRAHLEEYIEHLPLETDKKAMKVLRLCEDLEMLAQGNADKRYILIWKEEARWPHG